MDILSDYSTNPWEDELKERGVDDDVSDSESHQQTPGLESNPPLSDQESSSTASPREPSQSMPVQEPNQPAPAKKLKMRTNQRALNQERNQPTTAPQNSQYPSTNGLENIWKSVHEKIDDLRQQVRGVGAEVQRSQGLVHAVKKQVKNVNNAQIIERVDRDAWMGTTEIGGRLNLLQLEIGWIMHDLAERRLTPRNTPFPPRDRRDSRSDSPVPVTRSVDSEYFREDDTSIVSSPIRIASGQWQRRRREAPSLPRGRNAIPRPLHRRRGSQYYDTDERSGGITSGKVKYHTIPQYSRKSEDGTSVDLPQRQKARDSLSRSHLKRKGSYVRRRPHEVEVQDRRYSSEPQNGEQPERSASDDSTATKINDRPSEPPVAVAQELQEGHSQQVNQGVDDQETGGDPGNEEAIHEKKVKSKLEDEAELLQRQLSAVKEKIRLENQQKQAQGEPIPTPDQAATCKQQDDVQPTGNDCSEQIEDSGERTSSVNNNHYDDSESNASHTKTNRPLRARFRETAGQIKSILTHRRHPRAADELQRIKIHRDCWEWDKDDDNYIVLKDPLRESKHAECYRV